jgi:GNAT superfamily N-acetyltransferase
MHIVQPGTPDVALCARWRIDAFSGVIGASFEDECRALNELAADQSQQVALIAFLDGEPAGTGMLVLSEIKPVHQVSPWLVGLFVAPDFRRRGVGRTLVRAIEEQARQRANTQLYLYTDEAKGFYERLGWTARDRVVWLGYDTTLMERTVA